MEHDVGRAVPVATKVLEKAGYRVAADVLDLVKLGVPQTTASTPPARRPRRRIDPWNVLATTIACGRHSARTVEWAISDLQDIATPTGPDSPTVASKENVERMQWLIDNDRVRPPERRRPMCHHDDHSYVSMYGRLRWDAPAQTITTGFGSMGQGRFVHPAKPRTITPHEAARLQTLPDFFDLESTNTRGAWANVIGNAVPPLLGVHIVVPLLGALPDASKHGRDRTVSETSAARHEAHERRRRNGVPQASSELIRVRMRTTKRRDTEPEPPCGRNCTAGSGFAVDHPIDGTRRRADIVFRGPRSPSTSMDASGTAARYTARCRSRTASGGSKVRGQPDAGRGHRRQPRAAGWRVLRFWEHDDPAGGGRESRWRLVASETPPERKEQSGHASRARKSPAVTALNLTARSFRNNVQSCRTSAQLAR